MSDDQESLPTAANVLEKNVDREGFHKDSILEIIHQDLGIVDDGDELVRRADVETLIQDKIENIDETFLGSERDKKEALESLLDEVQQN